MEAHSDATVSDQKFKSMIDLMNKEDWELVKCEDNVVTERKFLENSDIACFRSSGFVEANPEDLLEYVSKIYDSFESVKQYDNDVIKYEVVEQLSDESRLCYQVNSMPWRIWARDVLYIQMVKKKGNNYWLFMHSVESPIRPLQNDQYVRAVINVSAYGFVPENDGCRVYRVAHINPGGLIPISVINNYADKTATVIKRLQQIYPPN